MFYVYIVVAAALIPILNNFFGILGQGYSWWLTPVLFLALFLGLCLLQIGLVLLSILFVNTGKPIGKKSRFYRFAIKYTVPLAAKLAGVIIHSSGLEKIPEGRMVLVSNHRNDLDPVIVYHELPDCDFAFIGKKEIITLMPFVAKAMHALNSLFIDRENNREAAKTVVSAIKLIKDDVASIGVFPEGYTNLTEAPLLPLRNGVFKIAIKAEVPIVVCTVKNTEKILKNLFRRKTDVYFDVLEVISAEEVKTLTTVEIGERVSEKMIASITKGESTCV